MPALGRHRLLLRPLVLVLVLLGWQAGVKALGIPAYLVPTPSDIFARLFTGLTAGTLVHHTLVTGEEILAGYAAGAAIGIGVGVLISQVAILEDIVWPYIVALNSVPKVAVAPLVIVWFGLGLESKVIIAALVSFFPLLVNVLAGLRSTDSDQIELMRVLTATRWQVFRMVLLPNALPMIFAGLEVAIVLSVVGAIVGEFVGSKAGLGYFIEFANSQIDTTGMFAAFVILAVIGWALNQLVRAASRRVVFWRQADAGQITKSA